MAKRTVRFWEFVTCPKCSGVGIWKCDVYYADRMHKTYYPTCEKCQGAGKVTTKKEQK